MLEWIMAAIWANYKPTEFFELDGELQSMVVAAYRVHSQIEAVVADEQTKEMKKKNKSR
jgi:hypothetical protein